MRGGQLSLPELPELGNDDDDDRIHFVFLGTGLIALPAPDSRLGGRAGVTGGDTFLGYRKQRKYKSKRLVRLLQNSAQNS